MTSINYRNLVIEGGGSKGYAYVGAILKLEELGKLDTITGFAGASVGSLFAAMLACRFTASDICRCTSSLDFSDISPIYSLKSIYRLCEYYGANTNNPLEFQIRRILTEKVDPEISLSCLYEKTKKDLVIVTCCLNRQKPVYLHHSQFPEVRLIDALLSSISIPYVFQPQKHNWFGTDDYFIDGGLVDNYPLWVFNDVEALYNGTLNTVDKELIPETTLGLKLLCSDEKNNLEVYNDRKELENIVVYSAEIVNTLMRQIERNGTTACSIKQTIPINTGNVSFVDFNLGDDKITDLIESGCRSVRLYFKNLDSVL